MIMVFAAGVAACRASPEVSVEGLDEPPRDFVLGVTVVSPNVSDPDRARRPARYIVEADGVLRASVGPGSSAETFPPRTRRLTPRQQDQLWRAVRETGLLAPDHPARVGNPSVVPPNPRRPGAIVYVAAGGDRRYWLVALDEDTPDAAGVRLLIDRLASLAWVPE